MAPSGGRSAAAPLRVLLGSMPFGALERPALGLGLLEAEAQAVGFDVDTRYFTFDFADRIGVETYQWLTNDLPYEAFIGEWLFADALYGPDAHRRHRFVADHLSGYWHLADSDLARIDRLRGEAARFVADLVRTVDWNSYGVVGFTSTFQQNLSSLALATAVKRVHPNLTIVFGGANWEGDMGLALHETFDAVDVVCSGEADVSFPAVLRALAGAAPLSDVDGITYRQDGRSITTATAAPIEDLDALPLPRFDAYFDALLSSSAAERIAPTLLVETARGCWWGAHSHCTFCGLNGASMSFRSKSPRRAVDEIHALADRWALDTFGVVDNILDMRYFRSVLQELAEDARRLRLFWEVKANLSANQIRLLADAGVDHVQPGIESMADDVLDRMKKGTSKLRNLAMLKHCREYGVVPEWNLLYGFPGESPDDYLEMARLFAVITHLQPPSGHGQIRLDRFSPYHADPAAYGMINVRPARPFDLLYPVDPTTLARISYYFQFDYEDGRQPRSYAEPVLAAIDTWRRAHPSSELWVVGDGSGALTLVDGRSRRRRTARLAGWKAAVYDACDRARTRVELDQLDHVAAAPDGDVGRFLRRCVDTGVMATDGTAYLSLAVHRPARRDVTAPRLRRLPVVAA